MNSFLWVFAVFCGLVYLFNKSASSVAAKQTPEQRQYQFVVDVCDGNQRRAQRLINEKTQSNPNLGVSQVLQLVYQDILELTKDERAAAYVVRTDYAGKHVVNGSAA